MSSITCQAITKKGTPCKNKAVDELFCKVHGGLVPKQPLAAKKAGSREEQAASVETTKTFELIVQAGANLVNALEKAINYIPGLMDNIFKYTGAQLMAPTLSEKMQKAATEKTRQSLQKLQMDFINMGADPAKLDQLLEKTRRLEKMAVEAVLVGDKYIPAPIKTEVLKSLAQLQALRKEWSGK